MTNAKYVILETDTLPPTAIIIPDFVPHRKVLRMYPEAQILGAGQMHVNDKDGNLSVTAFGTSYSLNRDSRHEVDAEILLRLVRGW